MKRLRKIPKSWKIAAVTPIHKKGNRKLVENYRPASLQNIVNIVSEKIMYQCLWHFLANSSKVLEKGKSVWTNKVKFLLQIYDATQSDRKCAIVAIYTDFPKHPIEFFT